MEILSLFCLVFIIGYMVKNKQLITSKCITIVLVASISLIPIIETPFFENKQMNMENSSVMPQQATGVYISVRSDFFLSSKHGLFGYLKNVQEITLRIRKIGIEDSIKIPFSINASITEVQGGEVYRTDNGYILVIPAESNEATFRFRAVCYGHTFFFKSVAYLPKDQNPLSAGMKTSITKSVQSQVGCVPYFIQLLRLNLSENDVILYELMEGQNVLGPIEPTYTVTHQFEQIEVFYTSKHIMFLPIYILLIIFLITCLTNNIPLRSSSNNLVGEGFERVLLWHFIATLLLIIGCSIIAKYVIFEKTVVLYVIAIISLCQICLAACIALVLLSTTLTKSLTVNTLMLLLIYPLLFISITVCYIVASSILGMPLAAHAVPPEEFGKLVTVQSILGFGGGNIPRLVLAFLGFYGGVLYLQISKRKELDLRVIVFVPIILICAYYYPLIGNDLLHILFNFISGEPTVFSHPLDQAYSGLVAKAASILGGVGYGRGMVMYGIAASLLAFLRYIKSPTISSITLLAAAPLFARGLMRVGDMKINLFLTSYLIGLGIGAITAICILLIDRFIKVISGHCKSLKICDLFNTITK